ncbi:trypsin beta-like [Drosophila takahashii]|uniref:trypsin beta-like n=1 Tax=Drosophila takahashii TaxID=29030 RepID=UPI001CF85162|nr:trypsin beta-like [Drosophila takahashii]
MFIHWIFLISCVTLISSKRIPGRIVGGKVVAIKSVPWQASLEKRGEPWCGAVIYSEKIVITAAHCTEFLWPAILSVRVGSSNSESGGQVVRVSRILAHEKFGEYYDISDDVAVIKLKTSLKMGVSVKSIPLANRSPKPGSLASVSGWGRIGYSMDPSRTLLETTVAIVDWHKCRKSYYGRVTKDMICASAPGKDSCAGDSGGPLVFGGKLVGIVSFGYGCADPQYPGVYADVAELKPWILKAIKRL